MRLVLLCLFISGCASTHHSQSPVLFEGDFNAQPKIAIVHHNDGSFEIVEVK